MNGRKRVENMKDVMIATGNLNKVREYREILEPLGFKVHDLREIVHQDVEETGTTFAENALIKARSVYRSAGMMTISDDSGLSVRALNGAPGIYSARYLDTDDYEIKNRYIIDKVAGSDDRYAWFTCAIAFIDKDGGEHVFEDIFEGEIACQPSGTNGFGYDPIFYVPEYGMTSAQMSPELKNSISHRGKATAKLLKYLEEEMNENGKEE